MGEGGDAYSMKHKDLQGPVYTAHVIIAQRFETFVRLTDISINK